MSTDALTLTPAAIGQNFPYIRWAISHASQLPDLLTDIQAIKAAVQAGDKDAAWAAFVTAGNLVMAMLADFPGFDVPVAQCTQEDIDAVLNEHPDGTFMALDPEARKGAILDILKYLPEILAFIQAIWKLIHPDPAPTS